MFRIRFETKGSFWVIEIAMFWGLYWSRAKTSEGVIQFSNYNAARNYVNDQGIDKVYADRTGPHPVEAYYMQGSPR